MFLTLLNLAEAQNIRRRLVYHQCWKRICFGVRIRVRIYSMAWLFNESGSELILSLETDSKILVRVLETIQILESEPFQYILLESSLDWKRPFKPQLKLNCLDIMYCNHVSTFFPGSCCPHHQHVGVERLVKQTSTVRYISSGALLALQKLLRQW